jgi:hypothetical protein
MGLLSILKKVSRLIEVLAIRKISLRRSRLAAGNAGRGLSIAAPAFIARSLHSIVFCHRIN